MKHVMGEHGRPIGPMDTIFSSIPCWDTQLQHLKRIKKTIDMLSVDTRLF